MEDVAELGVDDIITAVISHNASADALAWARVCGGAGRGCAVMLPETPPAGAPSPPDLFGRVSSAELSQAASTMVGQRGGGFRARQGTTAGVEHHVAAVWT